MKTKNTFKRFSQTLLAATLIAGLGAAQALPTGQTVLGGSATITSTGPSGLGVMSTAPSTVISWSGFDVAANESVGFNQNPLATGGNTHILNIINSGAASNIQGVLSAGTSGVNVYFVNPNGFVLNTPAAGTTAGNSPATGVASTLNFSNSAVTASQFMTSGAAAVTPQITINPSTPVSSMSGINIPAGTVTPPVSLLPTGGVPVTGGITISPGSGQINVTLPQVADGSITAHIINWATFDVSAGNRVEFSGTFNANDPVLLALAPGATPVQPAGEQYVLNRIAGPASVIDGTVFVNNFAVPNIHVFLMNPNGFVSGVRMGVMNGTGTISTSASSITDAQFLARTLPTPQSTLCGGGPIPCVIPPMPAVPTTVALGAGGGGTGGGTTPTPATNPFSLTMTPAEFAAALQTLDPGVLNTTLTSSGLGAFFQIFLTNGCFANPANAVCSVAFFHLLPFLSDPANFGGLLAQGGGGTGGGGTGGGGTGGGGTGGGGTGGITLANNPALGPLVGAVPGLNSYLALFNAAQNAAFNQLQTYLNQNPGYAQYAANTIAQAAPQAIAQAQAAMGQAMQQVRASGAPAQAIAAAQNMLGAAPGMINAVLMGASQSLANGGVPGLQNFLFGNTLNASFSNGVVNLGM